MTTAGQDIKVSVNGYEKTIHTTKNFTFQAGKMKTVNFEYDAPEIYNFTWDLSTKNTVSESEDELSWNHRGYTMVIERTTPSATAVNNYCPPTRTSTRFYTGSTLTITPYTGGRIESVVFTATTEGYANALQSSTWTNATASVSSKVVTVTPTTKTSAISAAIGGTCGFTSVKVNYSGAIEPITEYNIVIDDSIAHGTISADKAKAAAGATVTLTATPESGYVFDSWTVTDGNDDPVTVTSNQFTMPDSDVLVSATFVAAPVGTDVTFTAGTDKGDTSVTKDGITVTMSTMNRDDNYRTYASTDMVVSAAAGKKITQIIVTCTGTGTNNYGPGKFSGSGYAASSGNTGTWTGSGSSSVTLSASTQVRMTSIVVTYIND
jgi:hypothetical protein